MQNTRPVAYLPAPILARRERFCGDCNCGVNKNDVCAVCPQGRWKQFFCEESFAPPPATDGPRTITPSLAEMIKSATKSAALWAQRGFKHTDEETLTSRVEICGNCEFWNAQAFRGTGRCMKCGCSTWAKLRMATEKCPIGKW
jgi:hypothetical protein